MDPGHSSREAEAGRASEGREPAERRQSAAGHAPANGRDPRPAHEAQADHEPGTAHEPRADHEPGTAHEAQATHEPRSASAYGPGAIPLLSGALGMIAAISYSSWVLEVFLNPHLDVFDGYVSELSARDQPYHLVFSAGDFITGVLTIVIAATALIRLRRRPLAVTGWIFLLSFGGWAIGDSIFSMDCAPSIDTTCALRERAGKMSFSHHFHDVTSGMVIFSGIVAVFVLSLAARRYGWWPTLARWGRPLAIAEAGLAIATLGLMMTGRWLGLAQRVQITILCLALFVIAWALLAEEPPPRSSGTRPSGTRRSRTRAAERSLLGAE